jgi:hypothetical protein
VNQNELAIQRTVKKLSGDERRPVAISDLRKHLNWADGMVARTKKSSESSKADLFEVARSKRKNEARKRS